MLNHPLDPTFNSDSANSFLKKCAQIPSSYHKEGSIKILPNQIIQNRILLGIEKHQLTLQHWNALFRQLGTPDTAQKYLKEIMGQASTILLAIEEGNSTELKIYLEYWDYLVSLIQQGKQHKEAFALNQGIKWNPDTPESWTHDTYFCYPMLATEEIKKRLENLLEDHHINFIKAITPIIADTKLSLSSNDLIYLEVVNTETKRRSFDINCYKKELLVRDIIPTTMPLISNWPIAAELKYKLEPVLNRPLGHVSGGLNRYNEPFFTLYYELP